MEVRVKKVGEDWVWGGRGKNGMVSGEQTRGEADARTTGKTTYQNFLVTSFFLGVEIIYKKYIKFVPFRSRPTVPSTHGHTHHTRGNSIVHVVQFDRVRCRCVVQESSSTENSQVKLMVSWILMGPRLILYWK
jgi:hypothetical protein